MGNGKKETYQIFKKRKNKKRKKKKKRTWSKLKYDFQRKKTSVARSSDWLIEVRLPARENECGQIVWLLKCCSKFFRPST